MADITKGKTFGSTEQVTATKLHNLVDNATITNIVDADVDASAAIDSSKIDLSSSGYMTTGGNFTITGTHTYDTAPVLPAGTVDAITEIASGLKSGSDTTLITGTAGASNSVAKWNSDGDLVDGWGVKDEDNMLSDSDSKLATQQSIKAYVDDSVTSISQAHSNDTDVVQIGAEVLVSQAKTITSGSNVLIIATGYIESNGQGTTSVLIKHGTTTVQTQAFDFDSTSSGDKIPIALHSVVTGLSGSVTFKVEAGASSGASPDAFNINLSVMEFGS